MCSTFNQANRHTILIYEINLVYLVNLIYRLFKVKWSISIDLAKLQMEKSFNQF